MELGRKYDCDTLEEMLASSGASTSIVVENMILISPYLSVEVISFLPGLLEKPRSNIMLSHEVDDVLEFGKDGGCVDYNVTVQVTGASPEASCILSVYCRHGVWCIVLFVNCDVANGFMGL